MKDALTSARIRLNTFNTELPIRSPIQIAVASESDGSLWNSFAHQHLDCHFSHCWQYKVVLEKVFRYSTLYLKLTRDGELVGVFPSIFAPGAKRLISQPFQEYGGLLAAGLSEGEIQESMKGILDLATSKGCSSVEIRGAGGFGKRDTAISKYHPLHSYAELALQEESIMWRQSLTNEARKAINKSKEAGLSASVRRGTKAIAGRFYELYLLSMKRLGVPPQSADFFNALAEYFGDDLVVSWVSFQGTDIAGLLALASGERIQAYVTCSDPDHWNLRPNDLCHWELMQFAYQQGLKIFDFGSARYEGQIHYKRKWGAAFHDYGYLVIAPEGSADLFALKTVNTSSKTMENAAKVWSRYVPHWMARMAGPSLRRLLTK